MIHIRLFRPKYLFVYLLLLGSLSGCGTKQFAMTGRDHVQYEINEAIEADPRIVRFYAPYKRALDQDMDRVIGQSAAPLSRALTGAQSLVGNFFADAMLHQGRRHDTDIDISFGTRGGLRCDLPEGDLTVRHCYELMPFENQMVILEITGEQVRRLAEFIADSGGQPFAGMQIRVHGNKPPSIQIGGESLIRDKSYKVVTYDYLANGGDQVPGLDSPLARTDLPQNVQDALINYIQVATAAEAAINPTLDGRIQVNR